MDFSTIFDSIITFFKDFDFAAAWDNIQKVIDVITGLFA
ncbi:hypothetical protein SDC9_173424 [bioreactor metagenome]|uniref:Uncharacterized protein n=1 Tax=bioreactor metagenome TaxID=1076179 RepID=A0A645GJD5_9ZZZZ